MVIVHLYMRFIQRGYLVWLSIEVNECTESHQHHIFESSGS